MGSSPASLHKSSTQRVGASASISPPKPPASPKPVALNADVQEDGPASRVSVMIERFNLQAEETSPLPGKVSAPTPPQATKTVGPPPIIAKKPDHLATKAGPQIAPKPGSSVVAKKVGPPVASKPTPPQATKTVGPPPIIAKKPDHLATKAGPQIAPKLQSSQTAVKKPPVKTPRVSLNRVTQSEQSASSSSKPLPKLSGTSFSAENKPPAPPSAKPKGLAPSSTIVAPPTMPVLAAVAPAQQASIQNSPPVVDVVWCREYISEIISKQEPAQSFFQKFFKRPNFNKDWYKMYGETLIRCLGRNNRSGDQLISVLMLKLKTSHDNRVAGDVFYFLKKAGVINAKVEEQFNKCTLTLPHEDMENTTTRTMSPDFSQALYEVITEEVPAIEENQDIKNVRYKNEKKKIKKCVKKERKSKDNSPANTALLTTLLNTLPEDAPIRHLITKVTSNDGNGHFTINYYNIGHQEIRKNIPFSYEAPSTRTILSLL